MMSGLSSGSGASANGQSRKRKSTPAVDPEILGADSANDPWKQ